MFRRVWVLSQGRGSSFNTLFLQRKATEYSRGEVGRERSRGGGERHRTRDGGQDKGNAECSGLKNVSSLSLFVQRIHLEIRVGQHDLDAAIAQAKDKVNEVSFKLEHLIEQIEQIVKEQNYQRVSLPIQLVLSLPARNEILETKPPPKAWKE